MALLSLLFVLYHLIDSILDILKVVVLYGSILKDCEEIYLLMIFFGLCLEHLSIVFFFISIKNTFFLEKNSNGCICMCHNMTLKG
jgi:hypothetical protein